ncbi:MAG: DUF1614 domain-containing protein [Eubacteriales bacterium]|nr:DUF1614 domain-containing protein [Eubacteriales bacterium]
MIFGMIVLVAAAILVLFGVGQRVLDRMRLTDRQALLWMGAILVGGFLPNIELGSRLQINIGGFLVPLGLCGWLFAKADTWGERGRAVLSAVLCGVAVWSIGVWFPDEPETMPFDVNYLYGLGAGALSCLLGRSRRAAFIGGAMGVILADVMQGLVNRANGIEQTLVLGGAGAFDTIVIAAFTAVLLRELVGEVHERMTRRTGEPQREFRHGEITPQVLGAQRDEPGPQDETELLPPEEWPEDGLLYGEGEENERE